MPRSSVEDPVRLPLDVLAATARRLAQTTGRWPVRPERSEERRTGIHLLTTPEYDAWILRWPPGARVSPHDHGGSAGAFTVVTGRVLEVRWREGICRYRAVEAGETAVVARGVVHDVVGDSPDPALTVHVYSPPLTQMDFYDGAGTGLVRSDVTTGGGRSAAWSEYPSSGY